MADKPVQSLAFVILSYNSFPDTVRLCRDLLALPGAEDCWLILVDNQSPQREGYNDWMALDNPRVHRIETGRNLGYGNGNNAGIDFALKLEIDRVVVLNPDVYLPSDPEWIQRIQQAFETESFLVLGFKVEGILPYYGSGLGQILFPILSRLLDGVRQHLLARSGAVPPYYPVGRIYGCAFALRASRFRSLGLFDPKMFLYWEETVVSYVASRNRERVMEARDIRVRHQAMGSSEGNLSARHLKWMGDSLCYLLRTYRGLPWSLARLASLINTAQILLSYYLRKILGRIRLMR